MTTLSADAQRIGDDIMRPVNARNHMTPLLGGRETAGHDPLCRRSVGVALLGPAAAEDGLWDNTIKSAEHGDTSRKATGARYAKGNGVPQDYLMAAKPARMLDGQGPFIVGIRSIGVCLRGQSC